MSPDTRTEAIARLASQGGYILVVGGGMQKALAGPPFNRNNAQIRIWDDHVDNINHKEVPLNTRAILVTKWAGHSQVARLQKFAVSYHATMFVQMSQREVKEALLPIVQGDVETPQVEAQPEMVEIPSEPEPAVTSKPFLTEEDLMAKPKGGQLTEAVQELMDRGVDYSKRGTVAAETRRLLPLLKKKGITTSDKSISFVVRKLAKGVRGKPARVSTGTSQGSSQPPKDDFDTALQMAEEARAAVDVLVDFIKKLKREVTDSRKRREQLRKLLGGDL